MVGQELIHDQDLSSLERFYVRVLGAPIHGLRVRYRRLMPVLERLVKEAQAESQGPVEILDLGCGTGLFTMSLARHFPGCQVLGIDNWAELVAKDAGLAARAGVENCRFELGDALELNVRNRFELVVCIDNLEHIEDDDRVIGNINAALKPGGRALIHVPGLYRRWLFWSRKVNFEVKGHVRPGYLLEEIAGKVRRAGFAVEDAYHTYGWLETVSNNISYLITGADRRRKHVYALAFPFLNALAWLGRRSRPAWGAGVALVARKD